MTARLIFHRRAVFQRGVQEDVVVVMLPFPESFLELFQVPVVVYPQKILLEDADHALVVHASPLEYPRDLRQQQALAS